MFNIKKADPLVDSIRSIMKESDLRRKVEEALNEELGVSSRKAIPHEYLSDYDSMLEEAYNCAMKESEKPEYKGTGTGSGMFDPKHGGYHIVGPDGRTVMVSSDKADAERIAKKYGEGHKVVAASDFKKKVDEATEGSVPKTQREKDLAAAKPPYNKITKADVLKKRGVIRQEATEPAPKVMPTPTRDNPSTPKEVGPGGWRTEVTKEETLEEKAPPGAKFERMVKHIKAGYKKDGLTKDEKGIAYATAWKRYNKEKQHKMDESFESIMEEIRSNLEEKLVSVYESGDEQMFEEFVSSLTEEQLEILGLSEGWASDVFDRAAGASTPDRTIGNRPTQSARPTMGARPASTQAARPTMGARPAPTPAPRPAAPSPAAGARAAAEIKPGEGQKPAPVTGQPPAGSPPYQGAKKAGATNANLAPSSAPRQPDKPTFQPSRDVPGTAASGATNPDLTPAPKQAIPAPTPPSERRGTSGAFARAAKATQLGTAGLQESLESFLKKNYIKG